MRAVSSATAATWAGRDFTGSRRPMVRATIQRLSVGLSSYGTQVYSRIPIGQSSRPIELPNIRSVKWNRAADQQVATMTMTLWNTQPLPLGTAPEDSSEFDIPGYFTYSRGATGVDTIPWTHQANRWKDWIVPDRLIHTYEGYGFDPAVIPELDTHLYKSGTWLIDDVSFNGGIITIEARDVGRALIDQVLAPPIVPIPSYPLYFDQHREVDNPDVVTTTGGWFHPTYSFDSNRPNGFSSVLGHSGADAFDGYEKSFWLSVGNVSPNDGYSFEYVEGKFSKRPLSAIKFHAWGGPYQCFVSVFADGKWQGRQTVPYDPHNPASAPNGANIRYVTSLKAAKGVVTTVKLPKVYANATKVRICFTNLFDTGTRPYRYRAGIRDFQASSSVTTTTDGGKHIEPATTPPGFDDYSDIVKILLSYAGWHWPTNPKASFLTRSDGQKVLIPAPNIDPVLARKGPLLNLEGGRVWGDIQSCGTGGVTALGVGIWDKKPVLDGINYVKDLLGYIFYIDEDGAAIFRAPNIWSVGNWVGNASSGAGRTSNVITLRDDQNILEFSARVSSRSIREKVFVGNLAGQHAGISNGFNPYPSGLRRVGGYTDQHFQTDAECRIMADLITLRQLFTYRTDSVTIPGYPAIQVDDQVRIYERQSEEAFLHYVKSISMDFDMKTGKYTYNLSTHWLGDQPFSKWTFDPAKLNAETQAYLAAMGRTAGS